MKRKLLFIMICQLLGLFVKPQEVLPAILEQQLENAGNMEEEENEDDSHLQQLEFFRKHPLLINEAEAEELQQLAVLTPLQVHHFLLYRRLTGHIIDIYELQAIPYWDVVTIRRLLPYISIKLPPSFQREMGNRLKGGEHQLLLRYSQVLEKEKGYQVDTGTAAYAGGPQRYFLRYRYQYKNTMQWGLTADKDAGEAFFKKPAKLGFDFYSAHLFIRRWGLIKALALGDFTVNMGQGLIQWQSLAFNRGADAAAIKRQSAVLRPYTSAGEYNFHRGIGLTTGNRRWEVTVFVSKKKLSANQVVDENGIPHVTAIKTGGYHRTTAELADRYVLGQLATGANIRYQLHQGTIGVNSVFYWFDQPIQKEAVPYNLYALSGSRWSNHSIDYSYTARNVHFFGEAAVSGHMKKALLAGLLAGLGRQMDMALLYRNISPAYQALQAKAFTENSTPTNENGIYWGLHFRPLTAIRLQAYMDICRFPWLKYLVDAPSYNKDYIAQLTYTPNKESELYIRYRNETKTTGDNAGEPLSLIAAQQKHHIRMHVQHRISSSLLVRSRVEFLALKTYTVKEQGYMFYADMQYRHKQKPYGLGIRCQYFETDSYQSRIYSYENDVLYSYSVPPVFGRAFRYYLVGQYRISKSLSFWLKWAQSIYPKQQIIGTGNEQLIDNHKTELRLQLNINFF